MSAPLEVMIYVHEAHEGLARFRAPLELAGFRLVERFRAPEPEADVAAALLVVLGGPMGVYDADRFAFLAVELDVLRARLAANRPSIGLCLGAQLLAAAAGSTVHKGDRGMVIGVGPVLRLGVDDPLLAQLPEVFDTVHWHGDTFEPVPGRRSSGGTPIRPRASGWAPRWGSSSTPSSARTGSGRGSRGRRPRSGEAAATRRPSSPRGFPDSRRRFRSWTDCWGRSPGRPGRQRGPEPERAARPAPVLRRPPGFGGLSPDGRRDLRRSSGVPLGSGG